MDLPFLEFDLVRELRQLHDEPTWTNGHNAKTLVKYDDFRLVLMTLRASAQVRGHKAPGRTCIHMTSGHLRVHALGRTFDLLPGGLLAFDKAVPHDLQALEDSVLLLMIAWPGREETHVGKVCST
jgi:quercetin dioxygenase-like cupin family protein